MMRRGFTIFYIIAFFIASLTDVQADNPEVSVTGFFALDESGRVNYNFNPGWSFFMGDIENGESVG